MRNHLPLGAYASYLELGPNRSLSAIAKVYGVSKRCVAKRATKESWRARIEQHEHATRTAAEEKASETLEKINEKHLRMLNLIAAKSIDFLKTMPIDSAAAAVKGLEVAIRTERLIRGAPTDRNAISIEERVREETQRWLKEPDANGSICRDDEAP